MNKIQIHQFAPSVIEGDGISNGMFYLQKILHQLGITSHIYTTEIKKPLHKSVLSYHEIDQKETQQILLIHYSLYYDFSLWLDGLNLRKVMIYHNITPSHFFEKANPLHELCKRGVEYLPLLSTKVEGAIGVSPLNTKELKQHNFKNIDTIPLLVDSQKILDAPWDKNLFDTIADDFNIIFIGRLARNKAQHDLIEIANIYRKISNNFRLYIIGGTTDLRYKQELERLIEKYDLENNIILTGKVSNKELYAYYRGANLLLCMSEHEGFGIPLIESMLFNVPIVAFNSSNIKDTLNGGGILFNKKSYEHIAATIELIRENRVFKRAIIETQQRAKETYAHHKIVNKLVDYLKSIEVNINSNHTENRQISLKSHHISYQFEGPFDSSYSLALLNRYSAIAFDKKYPNQVSLFATEGEGDYEADPIFLRENPKIKEMHTLSQKAIDAKVVFRNLYPPRVSGMRGELNILNAYGWEESAFPLEYVKSFNSNLDGITVMSHYVKEVLKHNGINLPIAVVGLGVEHILEHHAKPIELQTDKEFKFLHISSCFPRKGVDVLLKAYYETFTSDDDVTLIIKTFPNPHNTIEQDIQKIRENPNAPEIILINQDLSDAHIRWLYENSHALVAPSRGEGFGLPMAEAMLFHLPVITTGFGGVMDFCNDENAWLIDYHFQKAKTHLNLFNSYWVEPEVEDLKKHLKALTQLTQEQKNIKTAKAYQHLSQTFRWQDYREKTDSFIKTLGNQKPFNHQKIKLAWVSSFNTKCGIATYSEFLINEFNTQRYDIKIFANHTTEPLYANRERELIRCWQDRADHDNQELIASILKEKSDHVFINFNFGFFSTKNLGEIIASLSRHHIKVSIIFHSVEDTVIDHTPVSLQEIREHLKKADNILVHNIDDLNFFKAMGVKAHLLPHGATNRNRSTPHQAETMRTIASYGFLLPHKGIIELIEAFALLKKEFSHLKLLLVNAIYPINESQEYYKACQKRIEELGVEKSIQFEVEFLEDDDSFGLLDKADLLVMPYRETKESASGAIRYAISTLKPILCTPQPIFNDVEDIVHFTKGYTPPIIAEAIRELIVDKSLLHSKIQRQKAWIEEHDWANIANRLQTFLGK